MKLFLTSTQVNLARRLPMKLNLFYILARTDDPPTLCHNDNTTPPHPAYSLDSLSFIPRLFIDDGDAYSDSGPGSRKVVTLALSTGSSWVTFVVERKRFSARPWPRATAFCGAPGSGLFAPVRGVRPVPGTPVFRSGYTPTGNDDSQKPTTTSSAKLHG